MLQKTSHIILSIILLASTIGMVVSKHYCDDELISISFFDLSDSCCDDPSCCHDESEIYQLVFEYSLITPQLKVDNDNISTLLFFVNSVIAEYLINDNGQSNEFLFVNHLKPLSAKLFSYNQAYLL